MKTTAAGHFKIAPDDFRLAVGCKTFHGVFAIVQGGP